MLADKSTPQLCLFTLKMKIGGMRMSILCRVYYAMIDTNKMGLPRVVPSSSENDNPTFMI